MRSLDRLLLHRFLPRVLSCACPSRVHRSGIEGQQVDCFVTTTRQGARTELVLLDLRGQTVNCLNVDDKSDVASEISVLIDDIDPR